MVGSLESMEIGDGGHGVESKVVVERMARMDVVTRGVSLGLDSARLISLRLGLCSLELGDVGRGEVDCRPDGREQPVSGRLEMVRAETLSVTMSVGVFGSSGSDKPSSKAMTCRCSSMSLSFASLRNAKTVSLYCWVLGDGGRECAWMGNCRSMLVGRVLISSRASPEGVGPDSAQGVSESMLDSEFMRAIDAATETGGEAKQSCWNVVKMPT